LVNSPNPILKGTGLGARPLSFHVRRLMGMSMEALSLSEIPRNLVENVSRDISDFVIGFVKLREIKSERETMSEEDAELGGSGTLVQIDETSGILTAHHVLENLPRTGEIGLIIPTRFSPQLHRVTLKSELLRRVEIARGPTASEGPDLGLLILPPTEVGPLKAMKSFYNLSLRSERMIDYPPSRDEGLWFLCGFAGELTSDEPPERGYARVKAFHGMVGVGWVKKEYRAGDFDYIDFEAHYGGINEPPESFGGFSGGGLWQVPLIRNKDRTLQAKELLLSGVAFYESGRIDDLCLIKCHGRRSVYGQIINAIKNIAS
jgi:hypothetical protein